MKIAIISDIHEDIVSLKKALNLIEIEKCDHIICLGDILGYPFDRAKYESTKNASQCISLIKDNCSTVLLGNHDIFHLKKIPQFHSDFDFPENWYELSPKRKTEYGKGKVWNYSDDYPSIINEKEFHYLNSLPEFIVKECDGISFLLSHFLYPNFSGYVSTFYGEEKRIKDHLIYQHENSCNLSICGHMHIEGLGIYYDSQDGFFSKLFDSFRYYSYGEKKLKNKNCCVTIPALADNGQVNGFAVFDTQNYSINAISLNTNRRFIL